MTPEVAKPPPHPVSSPHPSAGPRRLRLTGTKPFKVVTPGDPLKATKGPLKATGSGAGGSRLSWPEGEGKGRPKAGGGKVGPEVGPRPSGRGRFSPHKGKSKTLDYSDLPPVAGGLAPVPAPAAPPGAAGTETGLKRGREGGRASTRDRKMLKFISGIFAKSPAPPPAPPWAPPREYRAVWDVPQFPRGPRVSAGRWRGAGVPWTGCAMGCGVAPWCPCGAGGRYVGLGVGAMELRRV